MYNADTMPPYELPANKTRSGIKTDSSMGSGGFNEIRFEDKKGSEQIFIHGQMDSDTRIENDSREWIGEDRHLIVKRDEYEEVDRDIHIDIKRDHKEKIENDRNLTVQGKEAIQIHRHSISSSERQRCRAVRRQSHRADHRKLLPSGAKHRAGGGDVDLPDGGGKLHHHQSGGHHHHGPADGDDQ